MNLEIMNLETSTNTKNQLVAVNGQIARIMMANSSQSNVEQKDQLSNLNQQKVSLLVELLTSRHLGDNSIMVNLWGNKQDSLHRYSVNESRVSFRTKGHTGLYATRFFLDKLREHFDGDIATLIGTPNDFYEESVKKYILRTMFEIRDVGKALKSNPSEQDKELQVTLAERVLAIRARKEPIDELELSVVLLTNLQYFPPRQIIEVKAKVAERSSSFYLYPHYLDGPNKLAELIQEGGGYNSVRQSRSSRIT